MGCGGRAKGRLLLRKKWGGPELEGLPGGRDVLAGGGTQLGGDENNRGRGSSWGLEENRLNNLSREGHKESQKRSRARGERQSGQGFGERLKDTYSYACEDQRARDTEEGGIPRRKTDQGSELQKKRCGEWGPGEMGGPRKNLHF